MKPLFSALTIVLLGLCHSGEAHSTRTLVLDDSEVAVIRTGIGYSTIIQFDARPTSAVLGDQDAFKVEYIGNSLTVKPVLPSSRTNLFAFTDYDRFNFKLETTRGSDVDYLVRVKKRQRKGVPQFTSGGSSPSSIPLPRKFIHLSNKRQGVTLQVSDVAYSKADGVFVVSFSLMSAAPLVFEPGDIEILQDDKSISIENLYLDALSLAPGKRAQGKLLVKESSVDPGRALSFRFSPSELSAGKKMPMVSFIPKLNRK